MTRASTSVKIAVELHLVLNEAEARALYALTEYGVESFLKFFYSNLGRSCLLPFEDGLRSLFAGIRTHVSAVTREADECRQFIAEAKTAREGKPL